MLLFSVGTQSAVTAAEDGQVSGEVSATGTLTSVSGNKAKFNEYGDVKDGIYGDIRLKYDSEKYYTDFNAHDIGYDTQRYQIEGGKWGDFKFNLNYDEIPHNITEDAKTFYSGAGSHNLRYSTPPGRDTSNWNTFDYSTKRKNSGAGFKLDVLKPFFFDVSAAREEKTGTYPLGVAGTTPGGIAIELPAPISYTTDSIKLAAGYSRNPLYLSFGYFYSNFSNDNTRLHFRNPNAGGAEDTTTLPPENQYYKINLTGGIRLPLNSKLDINLATARAKSDGSLLSSYFENTTGTPTRIRLSDQTFNGKIDTQNLGMSLTSKPLSFIDTRLFLKYDERENKSDKITVTDVTNDPVTFSNDLFDYRKVKFGAELGFRLPAKFYLNTNYSHGKIDRMRDDIPKNWDDLYGVELRWTGLDFMTARVGYERLNRRAEFNVPEGGSSDIEYFIRRFDAAPKHTNSYKINMDFFPTEDLNFSLGYRHRKTDYTDTTYGLTGEKRDEFTIDADYLIRKRVKIFGSFDYERIRIDQDQLQTNTFPTTSPSYNWSASQKDDSYGFTIGSEVFIIPEKLTLLLQYSYLKSDGSVDYTYEDSLPAGRTQDNIDLADWDSYRLKYYLVKLTYNATKAWSVAVGYAYEKYTYSDVQYSGYTYVPGGGNDTNSAYLTGAYKDPSYKYHTGFVTLSYRF